jgi:hypothetical protein
LFLGISNQGSGPIPFFPPAEWTGQTEQTRQIGRDWGNSLVGMGGEGVICDWASHKSHPPGKQFMEYPLDLGYASSFTKVIVKEGIKTSILIQ